MKKNYLFPVLLSFIFAFPLFSQINFLSPLKGIWANKQMLILNNPEDGDFYYSIDGSDPETFGFAYDGPVLLDVTGNIKLNVTHISRDGAKEDACVEFTVKPDSGRTTNYFNFIQLFYESGLLNYSSGSVLSIPSDLMYSMGLPPDSFLQGCDLHLSKDSVLLRFIPCTLFDEEKNIKYRFIIKTYPQTAGIYSKRDVPFSITDWDTINFDNQNMLYKIDSEYWSLPKESRKIDRSVSHMISWQPLDFETGNPVEFFVLPPKPQIISEQKSDGSILYSISGDSSYTMSIYSEEKNDYMELFPKIGADVFYGDKSKGVLDIGIFSNSVYQGKIISSYEIDKRPPVVPQIKTTAKSFYSREKTYVEVTSSEDCDLYIALSEPYSIPDSSVLYSSDSELLKSIPVGEYRKTKNGRFSINWGPKGIGPAYYKLSAYTKNGKNVSRVVEYSIIIDQSSYYFDENADPEIAEGTVEKPFATFEQCASGLKTTRAVTLRVKGNMEISKKYQLDTNYEILDNGDACITFTDNGSLVLKGSSIEIYDCRIKVKKNNLQKDSAPIFRLENSVFTMKNCTTGADFSKNGTFIDTFNSIVNISDSILAVNSVSYANVISSVKSRINLNSNIMSISSDTCVGISASEGYVNLNDNTISVSGIAGRVCELFGVKANLTCNTYKAQLNRITEKLEPVYVNKETELKESGNIQYGF